MNCSSLQLKTVAAILFVGANAANAANAQMPDPPAAPIQEAHETISVSPDYRSAPGNKIVVITLKEPTVRHTCTIQNFEPDRLLCSQRHHAEATIYRAEDIEALIQPADPDHPWLWFTAIFSLGGGIIAGACFLASLTIFGAIPVAIVGGIVMLLSPWAFVDDEPGPAHDAVLYQRPGTTLAVKLR